MMNPFLLDLLLGGGCNQHRDIEVDIQRIKAERRRNDGERDFMEFMLQTLAEVSEDEPHKNAAKIMLGTSKVSHKVSQLCRFADPSKPDGITAETREDVINLLSHIESELDEFISSHPLPEGTIFDK